MAEQAKKIVSVEILHLDETGYGPEGKHTRREWRAECLENLLAGKERFEAWQRNWLPLAENAPSQNDGLVIDYADGAQEKFVIGNSFELDFSGYSFNSDVDTTGFSFFIDANFNYATFSGDAGFYNATFLGYALFIHVTFSGDAVFNRATFSVSALFGRSMFSAIAVFFRATFLGFAGFNDVTFSRSVYFGCAHFKRQSEFRNAVFKYMVDFESAQFDNVGHFEEARFNAYISTIPAFRGCKISETRLEFSDDTYFTQSDFTENAIKNISFLKRLADEHGQTDQALNFNAMELRAKRKNSWQALSPAKTWLDVLSFWPLDQIFIDFLWKVVVWLGVIFSGQFWFCVFTYLYEKVSDFGRSFAKPLFYLVILFFVSYLFGVVSAFENSPAKATHSRQPIFEELARVYDYNQPNKPPEYLKISGYRAATEYSLYRTGNFLDFTDADKNTASINVRLFGSEIEPWWARVFGFFKGIITSILLFLIALGLRNKYRVS